VAVFVVSVPAHPKLRTQPGSPADRLQSCPLYPALRYSPGERWRYRFSGRPDAFLAQRDALVLRIGPSASLTLLKPGPTTRNARPPRAH
jgi:hypothetical protein